MAFDYSRSNKRWQCLRQQALQRDKLRCQEALRYGLVQDATHVHHIWPAEDYPEYAYCLWNLVSLTKANHDAMAIVKFIPIRSNVPSGTQLSMTEAP